MKEAANQFVTSELDQHPKKNDGTTEKDMRYYEPISADGLTHAKAIIHQFLESLLVGSIGFASAKQLMSEIDAVLKEREAMQATPKP